MKPLLIERSRELMRQDKMKKELANDIGEEEKVYTTLSGKIYDQQSDHEPESYKCEKCGKSFNSLSGKLCHTDCIKVELYTSSSDSYMKEYDCYEEQVYMDTDKPLNLSNSSLDDQSNVSSGFNSQSSLNSDGGQTTLTCDWLSELATIATEPKTVVRSVSHDSDFASEVCHHSYAKPLDMSVRRRRFHSYSGKTKQEYLTQYRAMDIDEGLPSPPQPLRRHYSDENQLDSGYTSPMVTDKRLEDISHSKPITQTWPSAVWHCFIKGTLIRFANASEEFWHLAENLAEARREGNSSMIDDATFATSGLRVCHILDERPTEVCITFSADVVGQSPLEAMCDRDHPFIVKNKGWCSVEPHLTAVHYGIPCNRLEVHDITMSPSHPLAQRTLEMFESFKSLHFTSEDSSAVFALSNMAQKKKTIDLSPRSKSEVKRVSPAKKKQLKAEAERDPRCKRPMNAFMLYAKKHRVILMQKFPGRDNRSISVLLGDQWKKLPASEREIFAAESRLLAMEHKRINPDCWKRKRSYSTGSVV